jgi:hypothetical protein
MEIYALICEQGAEGNGKELNCFVSRELRVTVRS